MGDGDQVCYLITAWRLPVAAVLLFLLSCAESLAVDKSDGGYTDLLISIHKDVPYNETIVVNIKSLLRSSSHFLHRATNGLVYFKHVIINFPHTWPKRRSARPLSSSLFEKSDVRIDLPGLQAQYQPFTKQLKLCGKPGEYIQLAPTFLAELNDSTMKTFGNPAYVFVHEWAHYRYGVFDEYGSRDDGKYPRTYCENDPGTGLRELKLNACSSKFQFEFTLDSGDSCPFNQTTCTFHEECIMRIKTGEIDTVESSIMLMPYVANVSHFCDSTNGARHHNAHAPSEQNAICQGRSTWEVISENKDFNNLARANMSKTIEVTFEETQHRDDLPPRVVLVLDISRRMKGNNRMSFLKEAAKRYVQDIADESKRLAIITFSSTAAVRHPLMSVNVSTRPSFLNAVNDLRAAGPACIGCGLQQALQVLNSTDETPQGSMILLMSDDEENRKPKLYDVLPELTAAKVGVSTMAMGASADHQIEKLATMTGGKAFYFPALQRNTAILMKIAFEDSTNEEADNAYVRIANFAETFTSKLEKKFILDPSLGNNTVVIFDQLNPSLADVSVTLINPSGLECTMCLEQGDKKTKRIIIPSPAQDGEWTIRLESPSLQEVEVNIQVKSQAKDLNDKPIRVTTLLDTLQVVKPHEAIIYAEVTKEYKIVLDATAVAEVIGPNSPNKTVVPLHEDGDDPDLRKNDGIYSGYFVQFTGKGRYVVTVYVSGNERTRLSKPWSRYPTNVIFESPETVDPGTLFKAVWSSDEFNVSDSPDEVPKQTGNLTGAFQRVVFAGSFEVTENIMQRDVPPGDIWDIRERAFLRANNTMEVRLSWTWPGAQLTFGNASAVDIRASKEMSKLRMEFEKQKQMTMADVVEGDLDPLPVGSKHEVTFLFPSEWATRRPDGGFDWVIFLAARAVNSYGLKSGLSRILEVIYSTPPMNTTVATTTAMATATEATTVTLPTTMKATTDGRSHLWVWFLVGGIAVVIAIVAVLVVLFRSSVENHSVYNRLVGRWRGDQPSSDRAVTYSQIA